MPCKAATTGFGMASMVSITSMVVGGIGGLLNSVMSAPAVGQADTGITGLALLAFLGSGETHLAGKHRGSGAAWTGVSARQPSRATAISPGNAELFAAMYCHGIATLALSEAYALSGDDRLLPGLQRALQFTINAQHSAGGWRYRPNEPTDPGDMSQFGWQLMALKSADLGGLPMPIATRVKMVRFLQSCSIGKSRGLAGYRPGERGDSHDDGRGARLPLLFWMRKTRPPRSTKGRPMCIEERPSQRAPNYYYWYYGTLAMFQRQGDDWQRWNAALQAELLARQRWDGAASRQLSIPTICGAATAAASIARPSPRSRSKSITAICPSMAATSMIRG